MKYISLNRIKLFFLTYLFTAFLFVFAENSQCPIQMENQNNQDLQETQNIKISEENSIFCTNQIEIISEKIVEQQPQSNQILNNEKQIISDDQFSSQPDQTKQSVSSIVTPDIGPGKVGLNNIGNTCFFNSGIQCVSHVMDLVHYFISNKWTADLNITNPRGMKGELASAFAKIIQIMWSDNTKSFDPTEFKAIMGKYAPQFSGNDQEDAHEFITFLLDGLHEDLNRAQQTINNQGSIIGNGTDDLAVSKQSWDNYKLNHNSIINDLFQGLLRSELNCPKCKKTTTVFDPFLSLSLPLIPPSVQSDMEKQPLKQLKITYVPRDFYQKYKVFTIDIEGSENTIEICRIIRQKTRTSLNVMIGRIDSITHDISWGLVNENKKQKKKKKKKITNKKYQDYFEFSVDNEDNDENVDDDSGEYHAFEYDVTDYPMYWIPCYLVTQAITSEQIVGGPFLLSSMEEQPDEFELSTICEKDIFYPKWEEDFSDTKDDTEEVNQKVDENLPEFLNNGLRVQVSYTDELIYDEKFPFFANNFVVSRLSQKAFDELKIENILINNELANIKCAYANENIPNLTLQDCLNYFSMRETLDYKNMWYCPHCKQFVCADKKMDIWKSPKYLNLHLKRFVILETPFGRTTYKIFKKVSYPFIFDFQKYIIGGDKKTNYRLIGVIEHFGSLENGHYTALALVDENYNRKLDEQLFKWYNFNDNIVHKSSRKNIISSDAYILFYERIDD